MRNQEPLFVCSPQTTELDGVEHTLDKHTVHHLDDSAVAGQALRQLVAAGDHVAVGSALRLSLVSLGRPAGRVDVVPPRVVRVDRTGVGCGLQG